MIASSHGAVVVYPPRDAAGTTIDARSPGPSIAALTTTGERALDYTFVGDLGDRTLMVAGSESRATRVRPLTASRLRRPARTSI